jgi:iron complex transport system ATP-binding protein
VDDRVILELQDVTARYPGAARDALRGVSLEVREGEFHAVLGPNASGKTTLVRVALGAVEPVSGAAAIFGRPAGRWPPRELARLVGVVPQREENLFPQRVRETVLLGRYPHLSLWGAERPADHAAVDRALQACDAGHLAERRIWTLSGGEYQRVRIARALAQEPRLLVLDEPGVSLDVRHEMELFELARGLVDRPGDRGTGEGGGLAVVMITHHVNLAARFADRVLLLAEGRTAGSGTPGEVLTRETVARVFSWPVAIQEFEGRPQMVPLRRSPNQS